MQLKSIRFLSLIGVLLVCLQVFLHLRGEELCFTDTCSLVESYLSLSPLLINSAGGLFFLAIFLLSFFIKGNGRPFLPVLDLLLLSGFIAEGILLSIQIFFAHKFCSYCLIICCLIFVIGLVYRPRLFVAGVLFATLEIALFSVIKLPFADNITLDSGTYAVKTCSSPASSAYLIFSENCPHCRKVLDSLHGCISCEIHFNPVSKLDKELLPGLLPIENYRPEVNILALKLFGINSVPVIIERTENGFGIIKGDKAIIKYIRGKCFCGKNEQLLPSNGQGFLGPEENGVCSMEQECR